LTSGNLIVNNLKSSLKMEPEGFFGWIGSWLNNLKYPDTIRPLNSGEHSKFIEKLDAIPIDRLFAELTKCYQQGNTVLHIVAKAGQSQALNDLVKRLPVKEECLEALKKRNFKGLSPLHIAVEKGDMYTVQALVDGVPKRSNVAFELLKQKTVSEGYTALHLASANGNFKFIEYILTSKYLTFQQLNELVHTCDDRQQHPRHLATTIEIRDIFENWTQTLKGIYFNILANAKLNCS